MSKYKLQLLMILIGLSMNTNAQSKITSPNGGEFLQIGSTYNITWVVDTPVVLATTLELSIDSGATWTVIIANTSNSGSYLWTVPNAPSKKCLVRNWNSGDESDAVFEIGLFSGMEDHDFSNGVNIVPNPVTDHFTLTTKGNVTIDVVNLYNIEGKLVSVKRINELNPSFSSGYTFDVSVLPKGVYFVEVKSKNKVCRKKLVVN